MTRRTNAKERERERDRVLYLPFIIYALKLQYIERILQADLLQRTVTRDCKKKEKSWEERVCAEMK